MEMSKVFNYFKLIAVFTIMVCFVFEAEAQKKGKKSSKRKDIHLIEGDKYFSLGDYVKAAENYKKSYEADTSNHESLYKLADSYRLFFNYTDAEKYYHLATQYAIAEYPLSRYWYAVMLKDNGLYLEAQEEFNQFRREFKGTDLTAELYKEKALQEANGCTMAMNEMKKPQRDYSFKPLPVPVNSEVHDFSPAIMDNDTTIAITSARQESKGKMEAGVGGRLTDVYRFKKENGDEWVPFRDQDGFSVVNGEFGESAGSFTKDHSKFYFTRCDEKVTNGDVIEYNCAIYVSYHKNGKWEKPIRLNENINLKGQWNAQPSISPDGTVLFFVSRRPGGIGMHDIWYSTCPGDDNWSTAINMGEKINTLFSEISPRYYGEEKTLFFSSNGREGFGGLDVFFVHEDNLDSVRNIGLPFNSNRDDQDFVLGEKRGFISSNREGGIGSFDVYTFNIESKESLIAFINNDTIKNVKSISVVGELKHEDTKEPAKDVGVILADEDSKKLKNTKTNTKGEFRFDNLSTDKNYKVLLDEKNAKLTKQVKYVVNKVEVKGSSKEVSKVLFDNIYFDFDKFELKPEAKAVLDKLSVFHQKHPESQIELNGNTDSFGSDDYNKQLSLNRGNEAMNYLVNKGVDRAGLVVNAQGEGVPVANNNTEIGRQLNRRVEFYILGGADYTTDKSSVTLNPKERSLFYVAKQFNMSVEELEKYMHHEKTATTVSTAGLASSSGFDYYVVQPKNTLFSIARLYGMSVDELRALNSITPTHQGVVIGQKLKVKIKMDVPSEGYHQVKQGETLHSIAQKYGMSVEELVKLNALDGYILRRHMILKVK